MITFLSACLQQHRHMRDGGIVRAHAFRRFCFDTDLVWLYAQQFGHASLNFFA